MKHIKKHPVNDKLSNLSKDIKEQDHSKPASKKKLDADKSLSDADVSMKVSKPSNKKLDGENFLAYPTINTKKPNKPSNKNLDGEKFLSESDDLVEVDGLKYLKTFEYVRSGLSKTEIRKEIANLKSKVKQSKDEMTEIKKKMMKCELDIFFSNKEIAEYQEKLKKTE
jgi:hypothetical protein